MHDDGIIIIIIKKINKKKEEEGHKTKSSITFTFNRVLRKKMFSFRFSPFLYTSHL